MTVVVFIKTKQAWAISFLSRNWGSDGDQEDVCLFPSRDVHLISPLQLPVLWHLLWDMVSFSETSLSAKFHSHLSNSELFMRQQGARGFVWLDISQCAWTDYLTKIPGKSFKVIDFAPFAKNGWLAENPEL